MTDDLQRTVEQLYDEYGRDFSALDPDAAASYWHEPSVRAFPDRVEFDATEADRRDGFAATIADLEDTDYDHSEPVTVRTHRLSESLALSNVVWERRTADGAVLDRFSPLHLLCRTDEGWQFAARASRRSDEPIEMRAVGGDAVDTDRAAGATGVTGASGAAGDAEAAGDTGASGGSAAIEAFEAEYVRAFSTLEPTEIAALWNLPTLVAAPDRVGAVTSMAEAERLLQGLCDRLRASDYEQSEVVAIHAAELDEAVGAAEVRWHRLDGDGDVLERVATLHLLRETDDGWTVVAVASHPLEGLVAVGESS